MMSSVVRIASDPRAFPEFTALGEELAKLSHPACPDVDWPRVEHLCLTLFHHNGADLQSVSAFILARGQLLGLGGLLEGMALLRALLAEWSQVWPPMHSARLEVLGALFGQLSPLLRRLSASTDTLPGLIQLDSELQHLQALLIHQAHQPSIPLQRLREQIAAITQRVERSLAMGSTLHHSLAVPAPTPSAWLRPAVTLPPAVLMPAPRRGRGLRLAVGLVALGLAGVGIWLGASSAAGDNPLTALIAPTPPPPAAVRLDSLSLFEPGSAVLRAESTKVLIQALVGIKAQPGWLIVIAGHSDISGAAHENQRLSLARATAVRAWMQRMGDIPDSCFAVQGLAASQPLASNDSEAGRALNRRVDIQLVPQAGACGELPGQAES